jgi:hypothetical protein
MGSAMVAEPDIWAFDLESIDEPLDAFLDRVADGRRRVVVRRGGVPLVAIEPMATRLRAEDVELLREVSDLFADVPLDELDRQVDAAVAEVRRQRRERNGG